MKVNRILVVFCVLFLFVSCKKETFDCQENNIYNSTLKKQKSVDVAAETNDIFNIEDFAYSQPFTDYLDFLDTYVANEVYLLLKNRNDNDNDNDNEEYTCNEILLAIEQNIFDDMYNAFPLFQEYSKNEQYLIIDEAIQIVCFGKKKDLKQLENYIQFQMEQYAKGKITKEELQYNTDAAIEAYNKKHKESYPYLNLKK